MYAKQLFFLLLLFAGCTGGTTELLQSGDKDHIYSIVVSHLAAQETSIGRFVGTDVWIAPSFGKGDSTFYSWGQSIEIEGDLVDSLKSANQSTSPFPSDEAFGPSGRLTEIDSFHDSHYYGENMQDVHAKCLIQFWQPGFSADGKRCVVRFYYGPTAHGAVGTYLLRHDGSGWVIADSTISYYT